MTFRANIAAGIHTDERAGNKLAKVNVANVRIDRINNYHTIMKSDILRRHYYAAMANINTSTYPSPEERRKCIDMPMSVKFKRYH